MYSDCFANVFKFSLHFKGTQRETLDNACGCGVCKKRNRRFILKGKSSASHQKLGEGMYICFKLKINC